MSFETNLRNVFTRISTQDKALKTLINGNAADLSGLLTTDKTSLLAALNELHGLLGDSAGIDDAVTGSASTWSSTKITDAISSAIAALVNGAPTALDTLKEISDALAADDSAQAALITALDHRVRFDAAQTLTAPQQAQARSNIGAASAADLGDPNTDFVAVYEAGLQ